MRPVKKYDKNYLENIITNSKSFREAGNKIGIDGKTAKAVALRYNIDASHFKHGKSYEELVGKKFGKLKVLSVYRREREGKRALYRAKCQCDCGNKKDIDAIYLKFSRTGNCDSCIKKDYKKRYKKITGKQNIKFTGHEEIRGRFWTELKSRAKRRKIEFDIDIKYIWDLFVEQNKKCALSGIPIRFGRADYRAETTASLDRIDSDKGYIKENIQWVHKAINIMKNDLPEDIFIGICSQVSDESGKNGEKDLEKLSNNHFIKRGNKTRKIVIDVSHLV